MKNIRTQTIDTIDQIKGLVDWLVVHHTLPTPFSPTMYIDLEGVSLSRLGSVSILTLFLRVDGPISPIFLIDVHTLGSQAFETAGTKEKTLRDVLQDKEIPKVFFDVRNDSDALFAHFGVALQGVEDVQLMESATRKTTASRKRVAGLTSCIEDNASTCFGGSGLVSWKQAKENGSRLFKTELGGSYEVFNQRPIPDDVVSYCVGDVQCLPELRDQF
ncbi:hypothetical protein P154DRAFT_576095 [Amniculicola lignicola CBS 123094]|uniref:3'-5' exonuclease domain-containing protein n=1 Tax=Amniculicola lignicola CBS 123094 TaxID=1392246 RepID=A0A6A5WG75_9PLEO|nr:hypothetical protein P154DRAFT_576095 [Amniculicola lignicola CBS 123094]